MENSEVIDIETLKRLMAGKKTNHQPVDKALEKKREKKRKLKRRESNKSRKINQRKK